METSVPKLQTFFATKIVRKNHRKRGAQFSKRKAFLRKRGVRKGKRGHPSELRQILSWKTYSVVMYLGWWGKLIQSWCIWDCLLLPPFFSSSFLRKHRLILHILRKHRLILHILQKHRLILHILRKHWLILHILRKHKLILHILSLCMVKDNGRILITKSFLNF